MKTCKKILAVMLTIAMIMSMCAFTVMAEEETTTVTELTCFSFENVAAGKTFATSKSINKSSGDIDKPLSFRNFNPTNRSNDSVIVASGEERGNYLKTAHSRPGINYKKNIETNIANSGNSVVSISYDIMIPADDQYKENKRYGVFQIGASAAGGTASVAVIEPAIENGYISAGVDKGVLSYYDRVAYTYGEWVTITANTWRETDGYLRFAVYAGDDMIYYGKSQNKSPGMALGGTFDFQHNSDANNTTPGSKATATDTQELITTYTCYDNFNIVLLPETAKVSDADMDDFIAQENPSVSYAPFVSADCDIFDAISSSYKNNMSDDENGVRTIVKSKIGNLITDDGLLNTSFLHSSNSTAETKYEIVTENDGRRALKAASSGYIAAAQNIRKSIASYFRGGDTHTMVASYEIKIDEESKSILRSFGYYLGMENSNLNDATKAGRVYLDSKIQNGVLTFVTSTHDVAASTVEGALRSESRAVPSNEWFKVTNVLEITQVEGGYEVKVYGIYANEVIYVNEHFIENYDHNGDGIASDDLGIAQTNMKIGDKSTSTEHVTYYDSIKFEKNNAFDWSSINTDAWRNREVELKKDADGNVEVSAKLKGVTSGVLLMVIYDANGKMEEFIPVTTFENDVFKGVVPVSKLSEGKKVKGFLFDSLATTKALMPSGALVY